MPALPSRTGAVPLAAPLILAVAATLAAAGCSREAPADTASPSATAASVPAASASTPATPDPSAPAPAASAAAPQGDAFARLGHVLGCTAPFTGGASEASLRAFEPGAPAVRETLNGPEGIEYSALVIYPDDPTRRLEVMLDGAGGGSLDAAASGSPTVWSLPGGVTVGTTLAQLEAINGGPFAFSGLGWDYGGGVTDWKGGRLGQSPKGCVLRVQLTSPDDGALPVEVLGDQIIQSDSPAAAGAGLVVGEIAVGVRSTTP
jgi:hypothetical protein